MRHPPNVGWLCHTPQVGHGEQPDVADATVVLEIDAPELPLSALVAAARDLLGLVTEVAASVEDGTGIRWVVDALSKTSPAVLAVRPVVADDVKDYLSPSDLAAMVAAVPAGIHVLEGEEEVRPRYFSDRALEKLRDLTEFVGKGVTTVKLGSDVDRIDLGERVANGIAALLVPNVRSWGTLEGRLESVTVHGSREFSVYDLLTGQRVRCTFGRRIPPSDIGRMVERRVAVFGEIRARQSGVVVSVLAETIEALPKEAELPAASTAVGVLRVAQ